jgi:hypothetical protein
MEMTMTNEQIVSSVAAKLAQASTALEEMWIIRKLNAVYSRHPRAFIIADVLFNFGLGVYVGHFML